MFNRGGLIFASHWGNNWYWFYDHFVSGVAAMAWFSSLLRKAFGQLFATSKEKRSNVVQNQDIITVEDYFGPRWGHPELTTEIMENAIGLLKKVNSLLRWASVYGGFKCPIDPDTGSCVSGSYNKDLPFKFSGDGGWRPSDTKTGAPLSKHRTAHAVDVYDPGNRLDELLSDEILESFGLYREAPSATNGWCHLQDVPPGSGRRTYAIA